MQSLKGSKQTFCGLHATDVGEIFQGVNPQEVLRQFDVSHNGDQPICQSLNSPPFYLTDGELWFNQIETQFDLHQITNDDERYRLTCAALSGEVASDVRDVLLQPFLTHKYENLKGILIEQRGSTTPERVNKVISGEKLGSDIPSRFLRRLQKTAGFGTKAVVEKTIIRQAFIRQMPTSLRAH